MSVLEFVRLRCPACGHRFASQPVLSTEQFVGSRAAAGDRAAGAHLLSCRVDSCPRCGYAGAVEEFARSAEVRPTLREHVGAERAPRVSEWAAAGPGTHGAAADVASWRSAGPRWVADLLLRAARSRVDAGSAAAGEPMEPALRWWILDAARRQRGDSRGCIS
jgi:hypothetical protein